MWDALMAVAGGQKERVTASDIKKRFGRSASSLRFFCPICGERLIAASMSWGSQQSPHFRHRKNSLTAQECERYVSTFGTSFFFRDQKMPLPMFIRRSVGDPSRFIVEGGFRTPSESDLETLSSERAKLKVTTSEYVVNRSRFSGGMKRIPFNELTLCPRKLVKLIGSSWEIDRIWGPVEDAKRVMVFLCDEYTRQGRRVRKGETVEYGVSIYLLCTASDINFVLRTFPNSKSVGRVQCGVGRKTLSVVSATIPRNNPIPASMSELLGREEITVSNASAVSRIIWPPSLCADGEIRPLYENDGVMLCVDRGPARIDRLFVREGSGSSDETTEREILSCDQYRCGYLPVGLPERSLVVTSDVDSYERATIIGVPSNAPYGKLSVMGDGFECAEDEDSLIVKMERPATLQILRRGGLVEAFEDASEHTVSDIGSNTHIKITRTTSDRKSSYVIWQRTRTPIPIDEGKQEEAPVQTIGFRTRGRGVTKAMMRKMGLRQCKAFGRSYVIAKARRGQ